MDAAKRIRAIRHTWAKAFRLSRFDIASAQGRYNSTVKDSGKFASNVPHSRRMAWLVYSPEAQAAERSMLNSMGA